MKTLTRGSRGQQVEMLQLALSRAGYDIAADGIFGERTLNAVLRFQRSAGLMPDGIVGSRTWGALRPYLTGYVEYRVAAGDTFYRISKKYRADVRAIMTANPTLNPYNLPVGQLINVPLPFDVVPENINYSSALLEYCVEGIAVRYPFVQVRSIGTSILGKSIYSMTIGNGCLQMLVNASHHANEWITTPVAAKYAEQLAKNYAFDSNMSNSVPASRIYSSATIIFVPMVNPDGVDIVTGVLSQEQLAPIRVLASNYPSIPFPSGWKANYAGVDLNLNYPAGWERARSIKFSQGYTMPGPRDYVGPEPFSEPESTAMAALSRAADFGITLSYHTQGEVIYWKYGNFDPAGSYEIGKMLSEASGYTLSLTPSESAYAGYKDWFIQDFNKPGYTVEAGSGVNPLPISQFERIYAVNEPLITTAAISGCDN